MDARDSVQVIGESVDGLFASSLDLLQVNPGATGDAGDLIITTRAVNYSSHGAAS